MATTERRRGSSLSPPEMFLLEQWGRTLYEAFGRPPYLVGSVARAEAWRDVDVRLMLDDDEYAALPAVQVLNVAISVWGQRATGLPIDFQFQNTTAINAETAGQPRNALGIRAAARASQDTERGETP